MTEPTIRRDLARSAAALHTDLGVRLAEGLSTDDRSLAPQLREAVERLQAIEEVAESAADDALLVMLVAETTELLPITAAAAAYAEAARRVLLEAENKMRSTREGQ